MTITLNSSVTNNADWKTQFQFTDGETGDLIDFTGATIEVEVRDSDGCKKIEASTGNGKLAIISTGIFEMTIPASEMQGLCPANYQAGGVYSLNGETISLFTGTLSIVSGVARL
ncbi:hypothetical protein [Nitrobacter sp. TKz-YC02]|uniref:hypothetical protein n=1 Tax=Nitrobacter sp. TKz-YC02 TaxID=3398704 RepID=UPI003CEEB63C